MQETGSQLAGKLLVGRYQGLERVMYNLSSSISILKAS